jgi:hypothetical protein
LGPEGGKSGRPKQAVRHTKPAVDLGFQAKGGTLKKNAPSAGRCENLWGISCEKSGFYAKLFFSYFRGGGRAHPGSTPGNRTPSNLKLHHRNKIPS